MKILSKAAREAIAARKAQAHNAKLAHVQRLAHKAALLARSPIHVYGLAFNCAIGAYAQIAA